MFVWQKLAQPRWLAVNEASLHAKAGTRLAIIETPNRKAATVEIAATDPRELKKVRAKFGGSIQKLPSDWLNRTQNEKTKPIKIGNRLVIVRSRARLRKTAARHASRTLIIPASAAFGTGDHMTTAMSLRMLEQITRSRRDDWGLLDLGTGSGILALAAKRFGARRVVAIDSDATAISVAKANARLNRINGIDFRNTDARKLSGVAQFDIVSANLYCELLIEILPKLERSEWLILSGIMRAQKSHFLRALRRNRIEVLRIRRRGKWIALLCGA